MNAASPDFAGSDTLTDAPIPPPDPTSRTSPVYGHAMWLWTEMNRTVGSSEKMACVPLPWCASQSTMATFPAPPLRADRAAMATLLKTQKPIGLLTPAWCPGGRPKERPKRASPATRLRARASAPPAARSAAS